MSRYDTDTDEYTPSPAPVDDAPSERSAAPDGARRIIRGGWDNARRHKAAASPFPQRLTPTPEGVLVKFLDQDGPYTTYRQHWIQEIREGQRAFTCLDGIDPDGCPLCAAGSRATLQSQFNVAVIEKDGSFLHKTYNVGPTVYDQLSELHSDELQGPLNRHFWVIKRSKNGSKWTTTIFQQRAADLEERGYTLPAPEAFDSIKLWDSSEVRFNTRAELAELAATYFGLE